jgi:hypothetical protein
MFLYWIVLCISTLIEQNVYWLVNIHALRILLLIAMLNPKINLKKKIMQACFNGERPLFEEVLEKIGKRCV